MVGEALAVSKKLEEKKIFAEVINFHTIKPIDENMIKEFVKKNKLIICIEEHTLYGGLNSAISECLAKLENTPKMISYGIDDRYTKGGDYDFLKKKMCSDMTSTLGRPVWVRNHSKICFPSRQEG